MDAPDEAPPVEQVAPAAGEEVEEIEVVAARPAADEATFAVTVVRIDDTLPASADVATAVQRAPGVHVQRLGGLGDWSSVSIRGSTARQVEVFLDGVPLNPEGGAAADLSVLPLWAFERVEVYRGLAPLSLDSTAMGGAVDLVTRQRGPGGFAGALSAGSWGTMRAQAMSEGPVAGEAVRAFFAVDGLVTEGDARWFDDGGTRGVSDDDRFRRRDNNDLASASGVARVRANAGRWTVSATDAFLVRDEGVPGVTFDPLSAVRYRVQRHLPVLDAAGVVGSTRLTGRVHGIHRDERLEDPLGEVGAPRTVRTITQALGGRAQADVAFGPRAQGAAMASARRDLLDGEGVRSVIRAGAEAAGSTGAVTVSGTARALGADGEVWGLPRVGARVASGSWAVRAGAGRGVRIPDLTERYGDRGVLVGNPDLRAESAWTVDGSGVFAPSARNGRSGRVEVGVFATDARDRIVWARNAQGLARPDNVARATLAGVEAAASLGLGPLDLQSSATFTSARDRRDDAAYLGNQLPGIPAIELWQRAGLGGGLGDVEVGASYDLSFTAGTYDDPTNLYLQAPRLLQGATAWVRTGVWRLGLDARNLGDRLVQQVPRDPLVDDGLTVPQAVEDFAGLPLVGRTLLVTLSVDSAGQRRAP